MISTDLLNEFKPALATVIGQLQAVLRTARESSDPERELFQLKAAQALLSKSVLLLLDDVYRKAMAEKISFAYQNCTGSCGQEELIERLRSMFPDIPLDEVPQRLKEAEAVEQHMRKIVLEKTLETPLPPI
jgi:hypothetical protein